MTGSKIKTSASGSGRKETAKPVIPSATASSAKKGSAAARKVIFQLQTKPGNKVFVAGDFNNWDCTNMELLDKDGNGFYQGELDLKPGTYEYKFHINGMWCVDPENHKFRPNEMGTLNSVLIVK